MENLTYLLYSLLWWTLRLLPERSAYRLFESLASLAYRRNSKRVRRLRENFRTILNYRSGSADTNELETLVRKGLSNSMRYWCDTFRISDWSTQRAIDTTRVTGLEYLTNAYRKGNGVLVAIPHAGNWDHAGYFFSSAGMKVHTVAEHLKPDRLFEKFLAHREKMGMTVLDLDKGVMGDLAGFLTNGQLVALVSDRDLSRSGIDVNFFGATARMPAGAAALASSTHATLLTAYVSYTHDGIHVTFDPPIDVDQSRERSEEIARVTQVIADRFQGAILKDISSWHMLQRIFIDENFRSRS